MGSASEAVGAAQVATLSPAVASDAEPDNDFLRLVCGDAVLRKYAPVMREHEIIDAATVDAISDADFAAIGFAVGARVRLRRLVRTAQAQAAAPAAVSTAALPPPPPRAVAPDAQRVARNE